VPDIRTFSLTTRFRLVCRILLPTLQHLTSLCITCKGFSLQPHIQGGREISPTAVRNGDRYIHQLEVKSKQRSIRCKLDSGPRGDIVQPSCSQVPEHTRTQANGNSEKLATSLRRGYVRTLADWRGNTENLGVAGSSPIDLRRTADYLLWLRVGFVFCFAVNRITRT
jgi:hypothetical protein